MNRTENSFFLLISLVLSAGTAFSIDAYLNEETVVVPMVKIVANPERYVDHFVLTYGVFSAFDNSIYFFLDGSSAQNGILLNAVRVMIEDFPRNPERFNIPPEKLLDFSGRYFRVEARLGSVNDVVCPLKFYQIERIELVPIRAPDESDSGNTGLKEHDEGIME